MNEAETSRCSLNRFEAVAIVKKMYLKGITDIPSLSRAIEDAGGYQSARTSGQLSDGGIWCLLRDAKVAHGKIGEPVLIKEASMIIGRIEKDLRRLKRLVKNL